MFRAMWRAGARFFRLGVRPRTWTRRLLFVLWTAPVAAAAQDYQVSNWQVENGLPCNTVSALAQTPDGYLWVGTRKGLVRFDGDSFKAADLGELGSRQEPGIVGLLTDRAGGLWIAGQSGVIWRLAGGRSRAQYVPDEAARRGVDARIWRELKSVLAQDAAGDVWVLTLRGVLMRFGADGKAAAGPTNGLPAGRIHGLAHDRRGLVWLLKGTNACVFFEGQWRVAERHEIPYLAAVLGPAGTNGIYLSLPYIAGSDSFAMSVRYQPDTGWAAISEAVPTTPAHPLVMAMLEDHAGQVWLAQRWGGIFLRLRGGQWSHLRSGGLANLRTATCLFEDADHNIWIGTAEQGLLRANEPVANVAMLPQEALDSNLHVTTVSAAADGGFWAGTDAALYHGTPADARLRNPLKGLEGESIFCVLEDSRTNLWVGTQNGLFHRTASGFQKDVSSPPDAGGILALYEARNGWIWAAGPHDQLFFWRGGEAPIRFEPVAGEKQSCGFCCVAEDRRGRIWVGTRNTGIWRIENGALAADGPREVYSCSLRALLFDEEDALWIATDRDGLFRWSRGVTQHYTTEDGLPDDVILGLAADELGNIWMTSHNGIVGVACRQLAGHVHGSSPPLLWWHLRLDEALRICSGAGQPVLSPSKSGTLWAATMAGVIGFSPRSVTGAKSSNREVRIDTLIADGVKVEPGPDGFSVPAGTRRLQFQYSVPELRAPETLRFRYRLDGLDLNWLDAGALREATYSQLPPGSYEFRVTVGGADGEWREAGTRFSLRVIPQFWQTAWFRALCVVALVLALAGAGIWNERRKARRQLERWEAKRALERMRNQIARDLHDDLGSTITALVQRGDMTLQPEAEPEVLRSNVQGISGRLRELSIKLDEIVWTMNSRNDTLPNLAGYLSNHAQEFLSHSGIRCRLDVTRNLPDVEVDSQTRHNLFLAVKEALNNAAKHSGAAEVVLRMHYADGSLRVSVEDNGPGFDPASVRKGEGLMNMAERLEAVKGRAEILSQPARGTRVLFTLRLAPADAHTV